MNLTTILLEDDKKPIFMGELGLVRRIQKKSKKVITPQVVGKGIKTLFKESSKCYYCQGETMLTKIDTSKPIPKNVATIDHKEPISRGGKKHCSENKVLACYGCNIDKGHLTEGEYQAVLSYRKSLLKNCLENE